MTPGLGRLPEFDERSRKFDVSERLTTTALVTKGWRCPLLLDQGQTSACTGNARTYDLAAYPKPLRQKDGRGFDQPFAQKLYHEAQRRDQWPGESYDGSSTLGALKAALALGFIGRYDWAFDVDAMCAAICNLGPLVAGTTWLEGMFTPRPSGLLEIEGSEAGGHSYIIPRIYVARDSIKRVIPGEPIREGVPLLGMKNSWGPWGKFDTGIAFIWADDYERELLPGGDQAITTVAFTYTS